MHTDELDAVFRTVRKLLARREWAAYGKHIPMMGYPVDYDAANTQQPRVLWPHHILLEPLVFKVFLKRVEKELEKETVLSAETSFAVAVSLAILSEVQIPSSASQASQRQSQTPGYTELGLTLKDAADLVKEITTVIGALQLKDEVLQAPDVTLLHVIGWRRMDQQASDGGWSGLIVQSREAIRLYAQDLIEQTLHDLEFRVLGFTALLNANPRLGSQPEKYLSNRFIGPFSSRKRFCTCGLRETKGQPTAVKLPPTAEERETVAIFALDNEKLWNTFKRHLNNETSKLVTCISQHDLMLFHPMSYGLDGSLQFETFGVLKWFIERALNGHCGKTRPIGHFRRPAVRSKWASFPQGMLYDLLLHEGFADLKLVDLVQRTCPRQDCERFNHRTVSNECPSCGEDLANRPQFAGSAYLVLAEEGRFQKRQGYHCQDSNCREMCLKECPDKFKDKGNLFIGGACHVCGQSNAGGRAKTVYEYVRMGWARGEPSEKRKSRRLENWKQVALKIIVDDEERWPYLPREYWTDADVDSLYEKIRDKAPDLPSREEFDERLAELIHSVLFYPEEFNRCHPI